MLTAILISAMLLAVNFLKRYRKASPLLARFNILSKETFEHLRTTNTETIKKYLRCVMVWYAIDYFISASMLRDFFGRDTTIELFVGCIFFLTAVYFLIPRHAFEQINQKMNRAANWLLTPALVFGTGAYIIPSMKPSDLTSPAYANMPEHTKLVILKMTGAFFFVAACVCIGLLLMSLLLKYFVTVNYSMSNLVSNGVRRFSSHCIEFEPEEPHEMLITWCELIALVFPIVIALVSLWS